VTQINTWELQFHDNYANSHKFYRLYVLPSAYVMQWGRVGTTGQFKTTMSSDPSYAAKQQSYAKEGKGYERVTNDLTFEVELSPPLTRTNYLTLNAFFNATVRSNPAFTASTFVPSGLTDSAEAKQQEAEDKLKANLLKMAGKLLPEPEPERESMADGSMEARLAAALAKAKETRS
jgi:predicted DNA-binding WGR domain protein